MKVGRKGKTLGREGGKNKSEEKGVTAKLLGGKGGQWEKIGVKKKIRKEEVRRVRGRVLGRPRKLPSLYHTKLA